MDLAPELAAADLLRLEAIAAEAAALALHLYGARGQLAGREKSAGQIVTEADLAVEQLLRQRLAERFDPAPVLGEEQGGGEGAEGWVIDPIDGTANFLRGLPLWGISIALMRGGRPVLGVVALPALGETVSAAVGGGLRRNGGPYRAEIQLPPTMALGENPDWPDDDREAVAASLREAGCDVVRYRCASLGLAFSALGRLDGYVERRLKLWDIAAGWLLCREAGLGVAVTPAPGGSLDVCARR